MISGEYGCSCRRARPWTGGPFDQLRRSEEKFSGLRGHRAGRRKETFARCEIRVLAPGVIRERVKSPPIPARVIRISIAKEHVWIAETVGPCFFPGKPSGGEWCQECCP